MEPDLPAGNGKKAPHCPCDVGSIVQCLFVVDHHVAVALHRVVATDYVVVADDYY